MRGLGTDHIISATAIDAPPANSPIKFLWLNIFVGPQENSAKIIEPRKQFGYCMGILGGCNSTRRLQDLRKRVFSDVTDRQTNIATI